MLPVGDVIPTRTRPWVTIALIAANAIVFAGMLALPPIDRATFFSDHGVIPATFTWTTAFSSMFVHAGWLHAGSNLGCLWLFGSTVEDRMGHGRFLVFYLGVGLLATLAEVRASPDLGVPLVGASGAVAGVMGAYLASFPFSRMLVLVYLVRFVDAVEVPAAFFLGLWFLIQVVGGVGLAADGVALGGVALWADLAGFAAGAVLVWLFRQRARQRVEWWGP